jgi:hypothetical protein
MFLSTQTALDTANGYQGIDASDADWGVKAYKRRMDKPETALGLLKVLRRASGHR